MKRLNMYIYMIVVGLWVNTLLASERDCVNAQQYYNKAASIVNKAKLDKEELKDARKWLSKSINICENYTNWYLLGQVDKELGDISSAEQAYQKARGFTDDDKEIAFVIARYAEILTVRKSYAQALKLLHTARRMLKESPPWITNLAMELDSKRVNQKLTREYIAEGLNNRSIDLFDLEETPSVDLSIIFEFDSTKVVEKSKHSISVLAEALANDIPEKGLINIIGHADERGSEKYNNLLSMKRAQVIIEKILSLQPKLRGRLIPQGVGESQPLYVGTSENIYQMNRRVEIALR